MIISIIESLFKDLKSIITLVATTLIVSSHQIVVVVVTLCYFTELGFQQLRAKSRSELLLIRTRYLDIILVVNHQILCRE